MSNSNLHNLNFKNSFVQTFPGDLRDLLTPGTTSEILFCKTSPTPVSKPEILIWSESAGELLDLVEPITTDGIEAKVFTGNQILPEMFPYATRYGGHQFGFWAGQLGDGRAISLGEVINSKNQKVEIQLKGAGPTPYSRRGDGRAVLRSSLREFLCSEAMYYLNIPTTRALCCTLTGDSVIRDMFYDGNPQAEPGAITTRLAPSFLRFGHFEILTASGEFKLLKDLVDYTITQHYPEYQNLTKDKYLLWFTEVCQRTARLVVDWMRVGFVHGVMNTDNLSILGLTIDYGPYGWLDIYDPSWTPNTTDSQHSRYSFGNQANIAFWNLTKLAEALEPLMETAEQLQIGLKSYQETFESEIIKMFSKKLGFENLPAEIATQLITDLDQALQSTEIDPTIFYRELAKVIELTKQTELTEQLILKQIEACYYQQENLPEIAKPLISWIKAFLKIQISNPLAVTEQTKLMNSHNPYFILRNYLVQEALEQLAFGNREQLDSLMLALKTPYQENSVTQKFYKRRPDWAKDKAGCSALSCSS